MNLNINNLFTNKLPCDPETENFPRQVAGACYSYVNPTPCKNSTLLHTNKVLALSLGFKEEDFDTPEFLNLLAGNQNFPNTKPYAMCYGGHQFGHWAGQLGDGRAINLFQVDTPKHKNYTLQLKGAGLTPYSRSADGLAVLRSSVREYLCAEAMYHLGVPTTRSLSLVATGNKVMRDILYSGHPKLENGAIVCRVAESFIRFGNFQILAAKNDVVNLEKLINYTIEQHYPHLPLHQTESYEKLFKIILENTLQVILEWQRVGFVHGVMNTDNMSILGLTIDYGPYGWLDNYDTHFTPNTTDLPHKRYRFEKQPEIGLWNLYQLANAFNLITQNTTPYEEALNFYKTSFFNSYLRMMLQKIGIQTVLEKDDKLIAELDDLLQKSNIDFTLFFRYLTTAQNITDCVEAFYQPTILKDALLTSWNQWFITYQQRCLLENTTLEERVALMNKTNPKYIFRNYMAQLVIDDLEKGNNKLLNEVFDMLQQPYNEQPRFEKWFTKRPEWAANKPGCSMLSCSS